MPRPKLTLSLPGTAGHILLAISLLTAPYAAAQQQAADEAPATFTEQQLEFFEKQVRPVLAQRCFSCHSGRAKELKGGLRLDSRELILSGGDTGPAAVPGKSSESLLVDAINYGDTFQMPPKTKLPAREIEILTRWVTDGMAWAAGEPTAVAESSSDFDLARRQADHWCWQAVKRQRTPRIRNKQWPADRLDYFILRQLEKSGIAPAGPADRQTLIRRISFDLTGLPPQPDDVVRFMADDSVDATRKIIDYYLDSPNFGERWARHWMDLVRYAESHGHEFDYPIHHAYQYRDYLIRAFNADLPYDQFVIEQVAGDLLTEPRLDPETGLNESLIATGFWFLGEATHSPVDLKGDQLGRVDNQLDVMGKTFLGLTIGCARCHDHKFDAISTLDYYSLFGYLQSTRRHVALLDPGHQIETRVNSLQEIQTTATALIDQWVTADSGLSGKQLASLLLACHEVGQQPEQGTLIQAAADHGLELQLLTRWHSALLSEATSSAAHPFQLWRTLYELDDERSKATLASVATTHSQQRDAYALLAETHPLVGAFDDTSEPWIANGFAFSSALQTEGRELILGDGPIQFALPGQAHSGTLSRSLQGVLRSPTFTLTEPNLYYRVKGDGVRVRLILAGYYMDEFNALLFRGFGFDVKDRKEAGWVHQSADVSRYVGHRGYIEVIDHGGGYVAIDEVRQSAAGVPPVPANDVLTVLLGDQPPTSRSELVSRYAAWWEWIHSRWSESRSTADVQFVNSLLAARLLASDPAAEISLNNLAEQYREAAKGMPAPVHALAVADGDGQDHHVYVRGNHRTPGEPAPRRFLEALGGTNVPHAPENSSGRLELARQIASPNNPLTSRVMVNRIWHHLFGRGLVASVDNFGVLGQRPSHPELLDQLAFDFVAGDWSIKRLLRQIMLSSTYQMSSSSSGKGDELDPTNRLLHRANIRRLEGEAIRDAILAVSGRLDTNARYGPSIPVHLTPFMTGRGRPRQSGPLDGNGRRSVYISIKRNFLSPLMLAFDMPIPFNSMGRRNVSNVPSQALILMNDPFVLDQARVWGERVVAQQELDSRQRIEMMFWEAFSRTANEEEIEAALAFLTSQAREYGLDEQQASTDVRPWSDLGHVLFNMKPFTYLY